MKRVLLITIGLVFMVATMASVYAVDTRYVEIRKPFTSVYEYLNPKSKIIVQASKNDYFELVYEGTSWYQVKVNSKVGWVEKAAGIIVDNPGVTIFAIPAGTFVFFILLLVATITGAAFLIYRQKTAEI